MTAATLRVEFPMSFAKKYKIARSGSELGLFDIAAIAEGLKSGRFAWTDDCWGEGDPQWGKLSDIAQLIKASPASITSTVRPAAAAAAAVPAVSSAPSPAHHAPAAVAKAAPAWASTATFACALGILFVLLFGLFRQTKWEYLVKNMPFSDVESVVRANGPVRWEYAYVSVGARNGKGEADLDRDGPGAISATHVDSDKLKTVSDEMAKNGWELAGTALESQTSFPNFGKEDLHTGIKQNVRPQALILAFRRAIPLNRTKQDDMLNAYCGRMGEEGWELVSSIRESDANVVLTFKRPKR
jgi:hypothetical protein